jgi:hypothetical protein
MLPISFLADHALQQICFDQNYARILLGIAKNRSCGLINE